MLRSLGQAGKEALVGKDDFPTHPIIDTFWHEVIGKRPLHCPLIRSIAPIQD